MSETSQNAQVLLDFLNIDLYQLRESASLDDYICNIIDIHIKRQGYQSHQDFLVVLDTKGVAHYQLEYAPVEGLTVELLERWVDKLAPSRGIAKKPSPSPEELEKIMSVLPFSHIDVTILLKTKNLEDYITQKIKLHLTQVEDCRLTPCSW